MAELKDLLAAKADEAQTPEPVQAEIVEETQAETPTKELTPQVSADVEVYEKDSESSAIVLATAGVGELSGDVDAGDLILPKIIQVHGVGDLSQEYEPGSAIFGAGGDTFPLVGVSKDNRNASDPFDFIPLKMQKVWREYFDYNDKSMKDEFPREFTSPKAMLDAGCAESYEQHPSGKGHCRPALNMMLVVTCKTDDVPEELVPFFCDEFKDESFALCMWRLQKSAYSSAGKVLITDAQRALRKTGILSARYTTKFEKQKRGDNLIWVPIVGLNRARNSEDLQKFLRSLISG